MDTNYSIYEGLCTKIMRKKRLHESLVEALHKDDYNLSKELIDSEADINGIDKYGDSVLITAVIYGDIEKINFLAQFTPDLTILDRFGKTALEIAEDRSFWLNVPSKKYIEITNYLKMMKQYQYICSSNKELKSENEFEKTIIISKLL